MGHFFALVVMSTSFAAPSAEEIMQSLSELRGDWDCTSIVGGEDSVHLTVALQGDGSVSESYFFDGPSPVSISAKTYVEAGKVVRYSTRSDEQNGVLEFRSTECSSDRYQADRLALLCGGQVNKSESPYANWIINRYAQAQMDLNWYYHLHDFLDEQVLRVACTRVR